MIQREHYEPVQFTEGHTFIHVTMKMIIMHYHENDNNALSCVGLQSDFLPSKQLN